jgi:hypothetical protein
MEENFFLMNEDVQLRKISYLEYMENIGDKEQKK